MTGSQQHPAATSAETLVRPTEAQLRWAQFHHKRRAVSVRRTIELLYQFPARIEEVSGALPEDGGSSSSSSCSDSLAEIRRRRPKVSRGRRALLRVSRREYERRRQEMSESGGRTSRQCHEEEDHDELLEDIFKNHPSRQRRRRKDDESFKRFQAACHAMMMNLAAPPKRSIVVPSRKWTRTADAAAYLDDEYLDPKWGIRRQQHPTSIDMLENTAALWVPMDRGASWMIHVPKKVLSSARDNPYYHDPSLAIPPTAGFYTGSDTKHSESTIALDAPGAQKFSRLVALVQQRMIERQEEGLRTLKVVEGRGSANMMPRRSRAGSSEIPVKEGFENNRTDESINDFHNRKDPTSPWSPGKQGDDRGHSRKAHYVPRMRLRDFLPEGTTREEAEELERSVMDGEGIPPRMKLRGFPIQTTPIQQKSRAQEIAESFEPKEERRMSKTRQMAKSLEGPSYPMMRLRQSLGGVDDEKKSSEDSANATAPPRRRAHALSDPFNATAEEEDTRRLEQPKRRLDSPLENFSIPTPERLPSDRKAGSNPMVRIVSPVAEGSTIDQTPPRRKLNDMSAKFVQAVSAPEQDHHEHNVASPLTNIHQINSKVSKNSTRVSDFFSQLQKGSDSTNGEEDPDGLNDGGQRRSETNSRRQSTRKERASDFFASMRQLNPPQEELVEDTLLEDTDFFAQVREMIAREEDDAETASRRVSDFFAQMRDMSQEEGRDTRPLAAGKGHEGRNSAEHLGSDVVVPAPVHGRSTGASALHDTTKGGSSDGDALSVYSGISGMLNRGRTSLATTVTAISGRTTQLVAKPNKQVRDPVSTKSTGQVGGLLQTIQGKKELMEEVMSGGQHAEPTESPLMQDRRLDAGYPPETKDYHFLAIDGLNDLEAMATYRKSQEYKRRLSSTNDDASSHSSFHTLPTGILEAVKSRGSIPAKTERQVSTSRHDGLFHADDVSQTTSVPGGSVSSDSKTSLLSRPSTPSTRQAGDSASALEGLHHAEYRRAHEQVIRNSPLLGILDQDIIDTDGTTSDASYSGMDPSVLSSLMLSPDLLQKRLRQAVRAIEDRRWDQVRYLLNANPWLAEMCEITTNQYLMHKIAFFGRTAPVALCEHLIEMFPSAIFKFDLDGNVPLHLAAAAGNFKMIRMLGGRFASGASIRNEDGMLPLHFAIASYSNYVEHNVDPCEYDETNPSPLTVIKTVQNLFPKAVAIVDNYGNLPIHVAAECLVGNFGVEVVYMLLDEADRQLQDPEGARFFNKVKLDDVMGEDMSTGNTNDFSETESMLDGDIHCSMVRNDLGETPLLAAIRCRRGWDMIEALVSGPGGSMAAMFEDADKSNALHLLVGEHQDPAAAVSILKIAPKTAKMRNSEGMLPIEVACLQLMPPEVILAIALVDLPFDIDDKNLIMTRDDGGASWWFLVCECDDQYVDIVQQIVLICTSQQVQQLCFAKGGSRKRQQSVLSRATPKCKQVLQHALRFLGRFDIVGDGPLECDEAVGVTVFDALDYLDSENDGGRRVILKCYATEESFSQAVSSVEGRSLDPTFVEDVEIIRSQSNPHQHCLLIECPQATLDKVVDGMMKNPGYHNDTDLRKKYAAKMCAVLRRIAKALRHLHQSDVVHGNLCMANCGKFDHSWKLLDTMDVVRMGSFIDPFRFDQSVPPEALRLDEGEGVIFDSDNPPVTSQSIQASPSVDIWAFGKLAYESLVGHPLVVFDPNIKTADDTVSLLEILEWDHSSLKSVFTGLLDSGVTESCAEVVTSCLFPNPKDRPASMDAILDDPFWKDMRQYRERASPSTQNSPIRSTSAGTSQSLFTANESINTSVEIETAEINSFLSE